MMTDEVVNVWRYWRWQCDLVSGWWCSGPGFGKASLSQPSASVAFLSLRQSGEKRKKMIWKWNMTCHFFVFAAHFAKGPVMPVCGKMTPARTRAYMHTMCRLCIQYVCDGLPLPVSVSMWVCDSSCICHSFFLGCVCACHVWLKLTPVRRLVHPSSASPIPPPNLSLLPLSLHSSTLLSLHPCSPSSWHSDSTGEYAPSRSHPPFLPPAGGVSLETVSELTGWVQIDGCPLSDYTTGPLKATRLDLWARSHPSVLTPNGPFHLTRVNISSTQAESVCVCSFFLCVYWMSVFITCVCV